MTTQTLWSTIQQDGAAAVLDARPAEAFDACYLAIIAYSQNELDRAAHFMHLAAQAERENPVYTEGTAYLDRLLREGAEHVYASGEGFAAFIRGGGNVPLYDAVSKALQEVYRQRGAIRLLDIGVGDGLALLPALTGNVVDVTVVEPSTAMLARTEEQLRAREVPFTAFAETLQDFTAHAQSTWDVMQATFSLHNILPEERPALLRWLRDHGERLLIAEFDVPEFDQMHAPEHVRSVVERYRAGLTEYGDDRSLVAQGFLMPVMFGNFDRSAQRVTYETPLQVWVEQARAAGFAQVQTRLLYQYWWSPAYLIDARTS